MALIKLKIKGIYVDFVKDTLTIKKENNSLNDSFKIYHSTFPFLIIDNEKTRILKLYFDISSIQKPHKVEVVVEEGNTVYYGELQIINYQNGFIKCNLSYSSKLASILSRKIASFMPKVSVNPNNTYIIPYQSTGVDMYPDSAFWQTYPLPFLDQIFPQVKWQFPKMSYVDKYGKDLEPDDVWYHYQDFINNYDANGLVKNELPPTPTSYDVKNRNVVSPQVFVLSPLFYALESIGWKMSGSFPNSEFIKRILMLNFKNNLTETEFLVSNGPFAQPGRQKLQQMHPTIELGRYVPDWTLATYFKNLQLFFNLEINPEDISGSLFLNFNEDNFDLVSSEILKNNFKIETIEKPKHDSYVLKYTEDSNDAIIVKNNGFEVFLGEKTNAQKTSNLPFIRTLFISTNILNKDLEDSSEVPLAIYEPTNKPLNSPDFNGYTLSIRGAKGIFETFHKKWLKFLVNASTVKIIGVLSEIEINKITKKMKVYFDNQEFIIESFDYKENDNFTFDTNIVLRSINF